MKLTRPSSRMEEVKKFLTTSENQLRLANNKLDDVSVKKLTRKNPTMKAKFDASEGRIGGSYADTKSNHERC